MKNLGSDLIVNGNKVDKSLKTDDVLAMGRLLSPPIDTSHHPPPPPPPSTHHNENNTEGKQQVNLLVNFNNGVVGGGGGYFSLPRRTSPNGKPNWLLTSWPERLNNGDCRTCLSHDKTSSHLRTTSSTTSLNLITEIKGDSKVYMLPNGTTTPSPPHCPSSPPLANPALKSSFDPLDLCCAGRMVRSHSLGLDLPIRTNGDGCEYECPVTNQSSDRTECVFSSPSVPTPPLTLSAVLENIPIVYDPQTKKLHIIEVKESRNDSVFEVPINNNNNNNNNNEEQEFQCSDSNVLLECGHPVVPIKLNRVSTSGSLPSSSRGASGGGGGGECSSSEFSSVSSLSTEFSSTALEDQLVETNNHNHHQQLRGSSNSNCGSYVDSIDENGSGFIEINLDRHSITSRSGLDSEGGGGGASSLEDADLDAGSLDECLGISQGAKPKRRGITGFLSRNLLSWKSRDVNNSATNNNHEVQHQHVGGGGSSSSSWKLFSRLPPLHQECLEKDNSTTCKNIEEYHHVQQQSVSKTPRSRRSDDLVASSTTALILENRPLNLPAKAPEEELKHKLEYKQMVEAAKRRELKEAKLRKKYLQRQLKHEEQLSLASKIWNIEILPNWDSMRQCRKARDLWWRGIPPSVRGKVWKLAIGNDLHVTPELYEICVCRAKDRIRMAAESISVSEDDVEAMTDKEGSVELIKLDVSRTFPQLCIFQKGGPYYDMLHSLLGAYVCYRPDVGYVQGMSFLAAVLILNLEVADAFICFANLLNQPCQLAFFRLDEPMMRSYFLAYKEFFRENMPNLFEHFCSQNLSPDLYLIDWIYTLYSRSLPLDVASRVWDVYFRDGDEFLFRTALGILRQYEDLLLCMDFIHVAQFLTKLPEDMMAEPLFKSIESIRMVSEKRNFAQVLATHTDSKLT